MALYGIYGEHTREGCPVLGMTILAQQNREFLLKNVPNWEKYAQKYGVKILHQFHSGLEHTFLWVVDSDNAHSIQGFAAITGGRFNTIKIVPLTTFQDVMERVKQAHAGTLYPYPAEKLV